MAGSFELAQLNVGRMLAPVSSPEIAGQPLTEDLGRRIWVPVLSGPMVGLVGGLPGGSPVWWCRSRPASRRS